MQNRTETLEIITAIDKKIPEPEKMSILFSENSFTIYQNHKLAKASVEEVQRVLKQNTALLSEERTKYDIIAEYLLNKLNSKNMPYPDIQDFTNELLQTGRVN